MKRASLLIVLAALPMLVAAAAAADTVRIAHATWVGFGPLYIARDRGLFKKNGVDVALMTSEDASERFAALGADRIQMIAGSVAAGVLHLATPGDLKYVAALDDSDGGDGILARRDITTLAALRGRTVGFNDGSAAEFYLNVLLAKAGLSERDISIERMSEAAAGQAFTAGRLDAAVIRQPWLSRDRATPSGHLLVDSATTPGLITDALIVRTGWAASHPAAVAAVVRSWNEAVAFYAAHPDDAIQIMARAVGGGTTDPAAFKAMLGGVRFYDAAANAAFFGTPARPGPLYDTVQAAIEIWSSRGMLRVAATPAELITDSYLSQ